MAKQTSRAKPATPVLIFREKGHPKALILEAEGLVKGTEGVFNIVDKVVDAYTGETIFSVYVRDSFAIEGKHKIDLTIKNVSAHGIYVESVFVRIPKPKKEDSSFAKDGVLPVGFSNTPVPRAGLDVPAPDNPAATAAFFPKKIGPQGELNVRLTLDLLDRKRFHDKPYLFADLVFSKLDEKAESKSDPILFRIRWS